MILSAGMGSLGAAEIVLSVDGDIKTPEAARDAARAATKPVKVIVQGGRYEMTGPLVLGADDSGVTWEAAADAKPVFSGGKKIGGWTKVEGTENLWKTEVPEVRDGKWYFQQLWVNDQRATRARTPNAGKGFLHMRSQASSEIFPAEKPGDEKWDLALKYSSFVTDRETMDLLKQVKDEELSDVSITIPHTWDVHHYRVSKIDLGAQAVLMKGPKIRELLTYEPDGRFFVENYRAALDVPGEWFMNRKGELFYLALPGEDMAKAEVVAPVAEMLVKAAGVKDLTFKGIAFEHQQWVMGPDGFGISQAAQTMGAALEFDDSERITFDQCEISHVAGYALWFHQGCREALVQHCHIHDLGAGGVRMGATSKGAQNPTSFVTLDNNIIQHGGRMFPDAVGVFIGHSSDNRVTHNDIGDFYYTGISAGWHWGYGETVSHRNLMENNHIHHLGWGFTSDMGGFYGLGAAFGTVVRGNHIHHVSSYRYGGWGLYTDEGSAGVVMENNLVHDTSESLFHQHYGYYNTVRNNILAFGGKAQLQRSRNEARLSFIVERNIIVWDPTKSELLHAAKYNWDFVELEKRNKGEPAQSYIMRNNLYWPVTGKMPELLAKTWTWDEWRKTGRDAGSVVADPLFENIEKRDFRLKEGSPASKIGFKPWDLTVAGVRNDGPRGKEWRAKALKGAQYPNWEVEAKPWPSPPYEVKLETFEYRSKLPPSLLKQRTHVEDKGDAIVVTDEAASPIALPEGAPGGKAKRSLKLQDAEGLTQSYNPHYQLMPEYEAGTVTWSFDVMAKEDAPWYAEMRSPTEGPDYKVGPRLSWKNGKLMAGLGDKLKVLDLPAGKWARIETTAVLGSGKWDLVVTAEDGTKVIHEGLAAQEGWAVANVVLWSSMGTTNTAVYLDNLRLFRK
ncbi:right-handed parallel beta-helix repeat-containing protein [Phragmitibacter flavus]|uniref:right-handed parallel beta-helix repeat-containing protein n=1 Tax=Phragmitibacter flavus TaxID=2576071 RepID=UPI00140854AD|nr:right-handed parallel beta-helix repeat-containing protein [Phragmitibacter flavus]